jgi:hypothetical protein
MLATTIAVICDLTGAGIMAASLITGIATIIAQVANLEARHAFMVRTLELIEHAGLRLGSTECHVVLVTCIFAVLDTITDLVVGNTFSISASEFVLFVTREVLTDGRCLV